MSLFIYLLNFYIGLWLLFNIALSIDVAISIAKTSEAKKIDKINNFTGSNGKKQGRFQRGGRGGQPPPGDSRGGRAPP